MGDESLGTHSLLRPGFADDGDRLCGPDVISLTMEKIKILKDYCSPRILCMVAVLMGDLIFALAVTHVAAWVKLRGNLVFPYEGDA